MEPAADLAADLVALRTAGPADGHGSPLGDGLGDGRPFSTVDELNCYFDSPAEPNNVHLEVWLPGRLSPERLRAAASATLAGLPRGRARRAADGWWRPGYAWEFPLETDVDPVAVTGWQSEAELAAARVRFMADAPALDQSPPFRLLLARGPGWDSLILNAHHAAFDGRSCLRLLCLIADQYAGQQPPPALAAGRASVAGRRSARPGLPRPSGARPPGGQPRPSVRRTARITSQHCGGRSLRRAPGYGFSLLGWPGVPSVPQPRGQSRVTVNDVLIAALIQTIVEWNARRRRRPARVRITMPVDTRQPGHADELGNLSRLCTISVGPERTVRLIADVAAQASQAKQRPGPQVSPALAALTRMRMPAPVKRRLLQMALRCLGGLAADTCLLSNLGQVADPPAFGMGPPTRMWFSTSGHMPRGLSVGAITVGGRLQLCFRYRNALFDEAAAHDFAAGYAAALSALCAPEASR